MRGSPVRVGWAGTVAAGGVAALAAGLAATGRLAPGARSAVGVIAGVAIVSAGIVAVLANPCRRIAAKVDRLTVLTTARFERHEARIAEHRRGFMDGYLFQCRSEQDRDRTDDSPADPGGTDRAAPRHVRRSATGR